MKKTPAEIKFPCQWEFRLIVNGAESENVTAGIREVDSVEHAGFKIASGEASAGGKYCALRVSCEVDSLERARQLAARLSTLPGVKFMI